MTSSTYRAWRVVRKGLPQDALQLETSLPIPKDLKHGDVLLKVQAGALNPVCVFMYFQSYLIVDRGLSQWVQAPEMGPQLRRRTTPCCRI